MTTPGVPLDRRSWGVIDGRFFHNLQNGNTSAQKLIHHGGATRCVGTMREILDHAMWASATMIPDHRARQSRDGPMNCGNQPANISMIHRRSSPPARRVPPPP